VPDELDLGHLLRSTDGPTTGRIDADAVVRRARRRRNPKLAGTALASVLAVVVVLGGGIYGFGQLGGGTTTGSASSAVDSGARVPTAQAGAGGVAVGAARCGSATPALIPTQNGLVITVDFPATGARGDQVTGNATLTNTGSMRVTGSTGGPIVALSRGGVVVWHTDEHLPVPLRPLNLAPGASTRFGVTLTPLVCGTSDDKSGELRSDLPAAPGGQYQVSASIVVTSAGVGEQVTGPTTNFTVR
jgi:hypothetical protein